MKSIAQTSQRTTDIRAMSTYVEWDTKTWSAAITFWLSGSTIRLEGARVLEVGGRDGGLSLWLADSGAEVVCSDLHGPSDKAKALHHSSRSREKITHLELDATAMTFDQEFDLVVFKSVLGGIGNATGDAGMQQTLQNIHRALRPGGELFFAENLAGSRPLRYLRRRFVPWGEHWRYITLAELNLWLDPFDRKEFRTFGTAALLGRTETQRRWLATLDQRLLDRIGPDTWRYVAAGRATKAKSAAT